MTRETFGPSGGFHVLSYLFFSSASPCGLVMFSLSPPPTLDIGHAIGFLDRNSYNDTQHTRFPSAVRVRGPLACYSLRESGDYITLHYITAHTTLDGLRVNDSVIAVFLTASLESRRAPSPRPAANPGCGLRPRGSGTTRVVAGVVAPVVIVLAFLHRPRLDLPQVRLAWGGPPLTLHQG